MKLTQRTHSLSSESSPAQTLTQKQHKPMGDVGELWNAFREEARKYKEGNRQEFSEQLDHFKEHYPFVRIKQFTEFQYRFHLVDGEVIDIYPSNKKYHNITRDSRGRYKDHFTEVFESHMDAPKPERWKKFLNESTDMREKDSHSHNLNIFANYFPEHEVIEIAVGTLYKVHVEDGILYMDFEDNEWRFETKDPNETTEGYFNNFVYLLKEFLKIGYDKVWYDPKALVDELNNNIPALNNDEGRFQFFYSLSGVSESVGVHLIWWGTEVYLWDDQEGGELTKRKLIERLDTIIHHLGSVSEHLS